MKKRYTEEQIIGFLQEAESGLAVKELRCKHGLSEASYYLWKSKFSGMSVPEAKRPKELDAENARLKKLLAESLLENEIIKEAMRKSGERTGPSRAGVPSEESGLERAASLMCGAHERQRLPLSPYAGGTTGTLPSAVLHRSWH